jgi:hypothetical protein
MINVCSCCKFNTLNWYCITLKACSNSLFSTFSTVSCYYFAICQTLYATFTALPRAVIMLSSSNLWRISPHCQCLSLPKTNAGDSCFPPQSSYSFINISNAVFFQHFFSSSHILHHHRTHNIETIHLLSTDLSLLLCYTVTSSSSMVSFR